MGETENGSITSNLSAGSGLRRFLRQSFSDVRLSRLKYMLIFAHAPLFANMSGLFFTQDPQLLGIDAESLMRISYTLGACLLFIFASMKNMRVYSKLLSAAAAGFFFAWLIFTNGTRGVLLSCAFTFCFGGCGALMAFHFAYMLNGSERFVGAAITSLFYSIFQLDFALGLLASLYSRTYMTGLVLITLICMQSYKKEDYAEIGFAERKTTIRTRTDENKKFYSASICFLPITLLKCSTPTCWAGRSRVLFW